MSFATRNNRKNYNVNYVTFRSAEIKLESLYNVYGLGIKEGKYGEQPYVDIYPLGSTPDTGSVYRLTLPTWMMNDIKTIMGRDEDIADINNGKVGVVFHKLETKNGDTHKTEWIDLN